MRQRLAMALAGALILATTGAATAAAPRPDRPAFTLPKLTIQASTGTSDGSAGTDQQLRAIPNLVPDPAASAAQKQRLDAAAAADPGTVGIQRSASGPRAAVSSTKRWVGVKDKLRAPSDSTGAIGTDRYVEMVNSKVGIYSRSGSLISTISLNTISGSGPADNVFDPQVIWDGQQSRFFYAMDEVVSSADHRLAFGFSKTATPSSPADFCKYNVPFGATFPDYPKLGDTADFIVVGVNLYTATDTYISSAITWVTKPAPGQLTSCPLEATFKLGAVSDIRDDTGSDGTFSPTPAQQTDTNDKGWVVSRELNVALPSTKLFLYPVTRDPVTGDAVIPTNATAVDLPAGVTYSPPSNARQKGATQLLDTSDTRLQQAVSAIDPRIGPNAVALWTQQTVAVGSRSGIRWYEITPENAHVAQTGLVTMPNTWLFNAAISPDRQVDGATARFGSNMVMTFSTSSTSTFPAIWVVSKIGLGAVSAAVKVVSSNGPNVDFVCQTPGSICRWGDYSAATPDPKVKAAASSGRVWITNMYNGTAVPPSQGANWKTYNAAVKP